MRIDPLWRCLPTLLLASAGVAFSAGDPTPSASPRASGPVLRRPERGIIDVDVFVTVDVPTTVGASTFLPSDIVLYEGDTATYSTVLSVPGGPKLAGIFKLDHHGSWLFSLEAPNNLAGALASSATARDIVRFDASPAGYSVFFCGASILSPVPETSSVDAFYLEGGDAGDLIISFDVPTKIGAFVFEPSDLARFSRTAGGTCASWQLSASNPVFDASAAGIEISKNMTGASQQGTKKIFALDVPTDLGPLVGAPVVPGELVAWDGANLSVYTSMAGWPASSVPSGIAIRGNPGSVSSSAVRLAKSTTVPGNLVVAWSQGCSEGAADYAIYEGSIGSWYSHVRRTCVDAGHDLREEFTPASGNRYYLVAPRNDQAEGTYGTRSGGAERPRASDACVPTQTITPCPP